MLMKEEEKESEGREFREDAASREEGKISEGNELRLNNASSASKYNSAVPNQSVTNPSLLIPLFNQSLQCQSEYHNGSKMGNHELVNQSNDSNMKKKLLNTF